MTQHRKGPLSAKEQRRIRCREVVDRLQRRYAPDGHLVLTHNGQPTRYYWLESMAIVKYLHCDPAKLGVEGLEKARINLA